jgi:hypothetical protein
MAVLTNFMPAQPAPPSPAAPVDDSPRAALVGANYAPGHAFYTRVVELAPGLKPEEVEDAVQMAIEEEAPFPLEQLYYGFRVTLDRTKALAWAAFRRRFPPEEVAGWADSPLVLPDFAPAIGLSFDQPTVLELRGAGSLTAMLFPSGDFVPERQVSRPLPPDADDEAVAALAKDLRRRLALGEDPVRTIQVASPVVLLERSAHRVFQLATADGRVLENRVRHEELWGMDIRDREMLAARRRQNRTNLFLWRGLAGLAAACLLLLVGEAALLAERGWTSSRASSAARLAPEAERLEGRRDISDRLIEFNESNLRPFDMLAAVNGPRPASIHFTRATAEGRSSLVIEAATRSAADISRYEQELRRLPSVAEVEIRNPRAREEGGSFTMVIVFRPEALRGPEGSSLAAR